MCTCACVCRLCSRSSAAQQRRKDGAERERDFFKKRAIEEEAAKCHKLTDMFRAPPAPSSSMTSSNEEVNKLLVILLLILYTYDIIIHVYCQILIYTFNILCHSSQNYNDNIITFMNVVVSYCHYRGCHTDYCIVSYRLLLICYADLFCTTSIARLSVLEEGSLLSCSS